MVYKYTEEGCFKGKLLKDPPLPADHPAVVKYVATLSFITRRWFNSGCAVEEMGRMGYTSLTNSIYESAYVWKLHDLLSNPQPIVNNDGVGIAGINDNGERLFVPRFVVVALNDDQIKCGVEHILIEYFGFKQLAPYFSNCKHYGDKSRIGLYGLCTTRYIVEEKDDVLDNEQDVA